MPSSDEESNTTLTRENIGIAHLPNLKHKVFLSTPTYFNIIIAGSKGTGKSSFIKSLNLQIKENTESVESKTVERVLFDLKMKVSKPFEESPFHLIEFVENKFKVVENKSVLNLKVIEIDGVGDSINNEEALTPILSFIEEQNTYFYNKETIDSVEGIEDSRIHAFLYFFNASSPRKIDLEIMERVSEKVNLIPCSSKSDILMENEMERIEESEVYKRIKSFIPIQFIMEPNRTYSYGKVSDNDTLRDKLIKKYILQLKNKTEKFYALFKQKLLITNLLFETNLVENEDMKFLKENLERI